MRLGGGSGRWLDLAAFSLLALIWGTTWAAIRIGLEGIPPFTGAALRFGIAAAVLLWAARARGVRLGTEPREWHLWWVNGLFSFVVPYGIVYWAEQYLASGLTSVLFATYTLFVALLAHGLLPRERLTLRGVGGVVIGFAGVAVLFSQDLGSGAAGPRQLLAAGLMLLSPLAAAFASVAVKRWGAGVHPLSLTAVPMGLTCLLLGGLALAAERGRPVSYDATSVATVVYLALVGTALAFTLYFWLLERMSANRLALLTYLTPLTAVAIGTLFLGEPLTLRMVAGSLTVLAGVVLAARGLRP